MALTVSVGSTPIVLVQNATLAVTPGGASVNAVTPTLAVTSTPGTALLALVAGNLPAIVYTASAGFVKLLTANDGNRFMDVWIYLNNPGGILTANFSASGTNTGPWFAHLSEWSGVAYASAVDASGTLTATVGTTLAPTTTGNVNNAGDVAISAWRQTIAAPGAVTFTTPAGWTRLVDDGSDATLSAHLDAEYQLSPSVGVPIGPTLTSNTATNTLAAGAIIVLKAAHPVVDQTAYLQYGSVSNKLNTSDFGLALGGRYLLENSTLDGYQLEDGSGVLLLDTYIPSLGDPVTFTNPAWSGRVVSVGTRNIVERTVNYVEASIAATNNALASATPAAPGDFSDVLSGGYYLQEDGIGKLILEDASGDYLLEGTSFAYRNLSVRSSQNQDGTVTAYGVLETFEPGYAAGQSFLLTNADQGYVTAPFTITNVTTSFIGANPPTPVYAVEFGDTYQTLQTAGGGALTRTASMATQQLGVAMPGGVLGYAEITASQATISTEVDVTGLTATVTVATGRRLRISSLTELFGTVAGDQSQINIYEDATQIQAVIMRHSATGRLDHPASVIRKPTAGVHTYKLTAQRASGTGTFTVSGAATEPAYILVEDIGT